MEVMSSPLERRSTEQQYLPNFLLGDLPPSPQPMSPPNYPLYYSPPKSTGTSLDGPPIVGLFDETPTQSQTKSPTRSLNSTVLESPSSGSDDSGGWVVVFGHRPGEEGAALALLGGCGRIAEMSSPAPAGNWCAVRFATASAARSALALNGTLLPGNILIGVLPGTKTVLNKDDSIANSSIMSPKAGGTPIRSPMSPRIRPLTATRPQNREAQTGVTAESGIIGKMMDLLFTW